jgi:hypothetical protein
VLSCDGPRSRIYILSFDCPKQARRYMKNDLCTVYIINMLFITKKYKERSLFNIVKGCQAHGSVAGGVGVKLLLPLPPTYLLPARVVITNLPVRTFITISSG